MNGFNFYGLWVLFVRENKRFLSVSLQTVLAPVVNASLFIIIFLPFGTRMADFGHANIDYGIFLIPGLIMMSVLQNAFANTSSSMIQARHFGNIVFILVAPFAAWEIMLAFIGAAIVRGLAVGVSVFVAGSVFYDLPIVHPWLTLIFLVLSSALMGCLGLIAGIWAEKYDHLSGFQNFVITPLTFLSGVFYAIDNLPPFWHKISMYNPFYYMIDGLRGTMLGVSGAPFATSVWVVSTALLTVAAATYAMLATGYKLRN